MRTIFQTVRDNGNLKEIENIIPIFAEGENQWFGEGYYFWEDYIENAHWWGEVHYNNSYAICESKYCFDHTNCIDLIDNIEHLEMIKKFISILIKEDICKADVKLGRILMFARRKNLLPSEYKAVRGNAHGSRRPSNTKYSHSIRIHDKFYLDLRPQKQICFFDKSLLTEEFTVVHPEHYIDGYVI